MVWVAPGVVTLITPPQAQVHLHGAFTAGCPPTSTSGTPGVQGAATFGVHGWGVSTPDAADVALATVGLASEEHMPNAATFAMGLMSAITAAGCPSTSTFEAGIAVSLPGAAPKVQAQDGVGDDEWCCHGLPTSAA